MNTMLEVQIWISNIVILLKKSLAEFYFEIN